MKADEAATMPPARDEGVTEERRCGRPGALRADHTDRTDRTDHRGGGGAESVASAGRRLQRHQFHAPVLGAAAFVAIAGHRGQVGHAEGGQARGRNAVLAGERGLDSGLMSALAVSNRMPYRATRPVVAMALDMSLAFTVTMFCCRAPVSMMSTAA
ncbi:MAG: hypothetical protein EON49_10105 [Acidovorax sp.]|nr:MAG: hypothetical protein EON49_10105 [Acidovorax sp.]